MPVAAIDPQKFQNREELAAKLPHILSGAKDNGTLELIVMRPETEKRVVPDSFEVNATEGLPSDHWKLGSGYSLEEGVGDPDAQICMMMARCIEAIAGDKSNWAPAGDNLFIDMDLTPSNMPPDTRFAIGSAEFIVTHLPHNGCQSFIDRYGRDACIFVNSGDGKKYRLRGIYARVTLDGTISVGDKVVKLD